MTFTALHSLLSLARGPSVDRLPDATLTGVARAYLPPRLKMHWPYNSGPKLLRGQPLDVDLVTLLEELPRDPYLASCVLDLSEPSTAYAVCVGLALAKGVDVFSALFHNSNPDASAKTGPIENLVSEVGCVLEVAGRRLNPTGEG